MRKIHVIGNKYSYFQFHNPTIVFKQELLQHGFDIKYFTDIGSNGIEECDILIFHEDNYRELLPINDKSRQSALDFLEPFLKKFKKIIWYDANAGSGWLRSYIFPLVDIYAKNQLLHDKTYYQEPHPVGIKHRDYVVENFGIEDPLKMKTPLSDFDIHKLRPSWNRSLRQWKKTRISGLDWCLRGIYGRGYQFNYSAPNLSSRGRLIPYRMNYWRKVPSVTWWREQTKVRIENVIKKVPSYYMNSPKRVNSRKYHEELRQSVVTISPFGLGELCYRDFEAFINGSLLFKPSMSHIITYPDLYIENKSYIAHKWDFSDFEEKLEDILTHPNKYEGIAMEGQKLFREALSNGYGFCKHFSEMLN